MRSNFSNVRTEFVFAPFTVRALSLFPYPFSIFLSLGLFVDDDLLSIDFSVNQANGGTERVEEPVAGPIV
ncbi:unnamed protein product [Camellia sinensis]